MRLVADSSQKVFGCIAGNKIELLEFRDDISAEQKRIKRLKKTGQSLDEPVNLVDEVIRLTIIKSFDKKARFKSVSLHLNDLQSEIRVAVSVIKLCCQLLLLSSIFFKALKKKILSVTFCGSPQNVTFPTVIYWVTPLLCQKISEMIEKVILNMVYSLLLFKWGPHLGVTQQKPSCFEVTFF